MELVFLFVVIIGVVVFFGYRSRQATRRYWQAFADSRSLVHTPGDWFSGPRLQGMQDGYGVLIDTFKTGSKNKTTWTRVAITPPVGLPHDLVTSEENVLSELGSMIGLTDVQVGVPEVDARLQIRTRHVEDTRRWLGSPAGSAAATYLVGPHTGIREGRVVFSQKGQLGAQLDDLHTRALFVARQLNESRAAPWRDTAAQTGLTLTERPSTWELDGELEGVQVQAVGTPSQGRTQITVPLPPGLPPDLHITRGTSDLGDLILDRMVDARGADRDTLRALIAQDGIREDLLAVVHAHPGSVVTARGIVMMIPAFSDPELPACIRDAVALARSFEAQIGGQAQPHRRPSRETDLT